MAEGQLRRTAIRPIRAPAVHERHCGPRLLAQHSLRQRLKLAYSWIYNMEEGEFRIPFYHWLKLNYLV